MRFQALPTVFAALFAMHCAEAAPWDCKPGSFGTGPGSLKIETRTVDEAFKGIAVRGAICVEFVQGPTVSIKLEGDPEVLAEIETSVQRNTLVIGERRGFRMPKGWSNKPLRGIVTAPVAESLTVAGSGDLIATTVTTGALKTSVAGSGDVRIDKITAQSVAASVAGSGDIRLGGTADVLRASVAGSGDIDASRLASSEVSVKIAGSGDAKVWAQKTVSASIAGTGDIGYYGDPQVSKKIAGSGSVRRLGEKP
jgi:hypothetical protein